MIEEYHELHIKSIGKTKKANGTIVHFLPDDTIFSTTKFSYEILEEVAVLSENARGWRKELNLISWNGRPPKFDLREWAPDHEKMGKGITLTNEEFAELSKTIKSM